MRLTLLGPIFGAELRSGARRSRLFWTRAIYGLLLLLTLSANYSFSGQFQSGFDATDLTINQVAVFCSRFFFFFATLQLCAVLLVSPAAVGSLVARERERRTIEYLFATDLSNREIVLGKFAAGWCYLATLLMAGLPVLSLVMLMGGIPPGDLLAIFAVTLSTSLFIAALAILVSVCTQRARDGIAQTYLLMLFVFVGPFFIEAWVIDPLRTYFPSPLLDWAELANNWVVAVNPFMLLVNAIAGSGGALFSGRGSQGVEKLISGQLAGAAAALLVATWGVRRIHLRASGIGTAAKSRRSWRFADWRPQVGQRGMLWKEVFVERVSGRRGIVARTGSLLLVLAALGLTVFIVLAGFDAFEASTRRREAAGSNAVLGTVIACAMLLMISLRASTSIAAERERDTWTSLLCTPLSAAEILWSKIAGCFYATRWVAVVLVLNWLGTIILLPRFVLSLPFLAGTLLILAMFAATLGLFFSLWCRNSTRALVSTLSVAFVLGGGYGLCCGCLLAPFLWESSTGMGELTTIVLLAPLVPFLLGLPTSVGIMGADPGSDVRFPLAYLLGNVAYLVAAAALLLLSHVRFERLAGRLITDEREAVPESLVTDRLTRLSSEPPSTDE